MLPPAELTTEVRLETDLRFAFRAVQRALQSFREEMKGPSMIALQSTLSKCSLLVNQLYY
jgi:DNA polymerase epsilon subunit 1